MSLWLFMTILRYIWRLYNDFFIYLQQCDTITTRCNIEFILCNPSFECLIISHTYHQSKINGEYKWLFVRSIFINIVSFVTQQLHIKNTHTSCFNVFLAIYLPLLMFSISRQIPYLWGMYYRFRIGDINKYKKCGLSAKETSL